MGVTIPNSLSGDRLDILALSDIFRRGAGAMPEEFLVSIRSVMNLATYLYPEHPNLPANGTVFRGIAAVLENIAHNYIDATECGAQGCVVVLPIAANSLIGELIARRVPMQYGAVTFQLQSAPYVSMPSLHPFAVIPALDRKTPFAQGVRGLADIKYDANMN